MKVILFGVECLVKTCVRIDLLFNITDRQSERLAGKQTDMFAE